MHAGLAAPVTNERPAPLYMSYETIVWEVADGVATLTLNRPDVHNAMNERMRGELVACFGGLVANDDVRVVVVTGAGERAFSAGADIREFVAPQVPVRFRETRRRLDFRQLLDRCPQPIVAAIRGYAFGGGLELALACDIRIAGDDARLGLTEVDLAIIPGGGGTQRLPRLVGRGKALEMILTGARIDAREALRIGLVERVVPAAEVKAAGLELARTLAAKAPVALRYAKEAVVKGLELPLADGLRLENDLATLLRTTEDRIEGAKAFLEKRKPRFTGT